MSKQRLYFIFSILLLMWGVLVARAAFVQIFPNERLAQLKKRQFETTLQIPSRRGVILDRNGRELAASIASYSLYADPKVLEDKNRTIKELNKILNIPIPHLKAKLKDRSRRFVWLKRQMSETDMQKIKKLDNRGLAFFEEPKRIYPNGTLLAHTLGFVGTEGHGLEGLEMRWEKLLRGEMKQVIVQRDARGRPLISDGRALFETPDGSDLELTIDSEMQFQLEKELQLAVDEQQADSAIGMILDAKTSEVLAIGSLPTFDLNNALQVSTNKRRHRVITDAFEPGSTFKTFVIAAAIDEGLIKPASRFYGEKGRMKVGDKWINEADAHHRFEWLTTTEILAYSSNIGAAKIGFMLGDEKLRKHLTDYGFGQRAGLDIPGEARGILHPLPWRPHLLSNISFGHGISVTPLQLVMSYAAVANGGVLKTPLLVKAVRNKMLAEEEVFETKEIRRVMSPTTAATMRMMLTAATSDKANGANARIPGFLVGGKTGTAQKVDFEKGGYVKGAYISSFAGMVPANDPRFVIYVAVDNPRKAYYGSQVAAPVFSRLAQYAVRREGVAPTLITERNMIKSPKRTPAALVTSTAPVLVEEGSEVPDLYGLTLREALAKLYGQPIQVDIHGSGQIVRTVPPPGAPMGENRNLKLILENPN